MWALHRPHHRFPAGFPPISRALFTTPAARLRTSAALGSGAWYRRLPSFHAGSSQSHSQRTSKKKRTVWPSWVHRRAFQVSSSAALCTCQSRLQATSHNAITPSGSNRFALALSLPNTCPVHSGGIPFLSTMELWMWSTIRCQWGDVLSPIFSPGTCGAGLGLAGVAEWGLVFGFEAAGVVVAGVEDEERAVTSPCPDRFSRNLATLIRAVSLSFSSRTMRLQDTVTSPFSCVSLSHVPESTSSVMTVAAWSAVDRITRAHDIVLKVSIPLV